MEIRKSKDFFSKQSNEYAKYRPNYPDELFSYLASLVQECKWAWDCGTGNGQAAMKLTQYFDHVIATDISEKQLAHATPHEKIEYRQGSAEKSGIKDNKVNLITVSQAFHWFDQEKFYQEVKRVSKPEGVIAIWCYELARITPEVDQLVYHFYKNILGSYWEKERQLVEEKYQNIFWPFKEIKSPSFQMIAQWSLEHLIGYLGTWSALQTFINKNGYNPLESLCTDLQKAWGKISVRQASWELGLRVGKMQ